MVVYCGQGLWSVVAYIWDRQLPGCLLIMSKFPAGQLLEASVMNSTHKTDLKVRFKGTALDQGGRQGKDTSQWGWNYGND